MSRPLLSTRRQLELMRSLQRHAHRRHEREEAIREAYEMGVAQATMRRERARKSLQADYDERRAEREQQNADDRERVAAETERVSQAVRLEYQRVRSQLEREQESARADAHKRYNDDTWQAKSVYDARKDQPRQRLEEAGERIGEALSQVRDTVATANMLLAQRLLGVRPVELAEPAPAGEAAPDEATDQRVEQEISHVAAHAEEARAAVQRLYDALLSRLFDGWSPVGIVLAVWALSVPVVFFGAGFAWTGWVGWAVTGLVALLAGAGLWLFVRPRAQRVTQEAYDEVIAAANSARQTGALAFALAEARSRRLAQELVRQRDSELERLSEWVQQTRAEQKARFKSEFERINAEYPERLKKTREEHQEEIARLERELRDTIAGITEERDRQLAEAARECEEATARLAAERDAAWEALREEWLAACAAASSEAADMRAQCERLFPDWSRTDYQAWDKPAEPTLAVEFGRVMLDLAAMKHGLSEDERLRPPETRIEVPALVTLTEQPALVISADGPSQKQGVELLRAVALRFLTGQPPGKVRLTLLDPAGLGEGLSSFMHLADFEEDLIARRIWSEPRDIDEQLARLTAHMETVIQKYLRSEYDSIHEYNATAGEVAEPFQVVVVSGFPANFSDAAARRLANIAAGGPRCGVYVLALVDRKRKLPSDFSLEELAADAVRLDWDGERGRFVWREPVFERLPLEVAIAPAPERMVEVVRAAGAAAKEAVRVEVPFRIVAPPADALWAKSSAEELRIPMGRAGANRLQEMRLGKGTSQHLLVAGKTGSGKSTFLHALVTSGALHYSPDELEYYLVDFKKGVEFKSYANSRLPHARVVAIESEREFGLSVLERLDEELKRRGELYRQVAVQNLADYRAARPDEPMPRILLVIDEFQELFVEDDRLASEATLLLDRLVRQGRAFGVHVLLGTQTLAGAYSIARSTLGQIAVRVALECSEADAHLILADERNQAARFLSRPGEAIYNDQNGLASANEPFQVVWLPDAERSERLRALDEHRQQSGMAAPKQIVFEGNAPAEQSTNEALTARLSGVAPEPDAEPVAWLGDAVAIKDPTYATFGRHAGANLLVVGPQETSALGVMATAVVSLTAADPQARVVVLDGSRRGDAAHGVWPQVADALPGDAQLVAPTDIGPSLAELAEEVSRREEASDADTYAPLYLVVWSGGRFRDLRRRDDDFSFSMDRDKPTTPDKHLTEILRNGPAVAVHVLVWCDGYNQASRMFDRVTMREFAMRVAFQMSAADSSNLLDTPAASALRQHRALFYSDETGESEKFRPYGPPSGEWLKAIRRPVGRVPG